MRLTKLLMPLEPGEFGSLNHVRHIEELAGMTEEFQDDLKAHYDEGVQSEGLDSKDLV
jgi:hypothetical protein